jgi:hypothetical protein
MTEVYFCKGDTEVSRSSSSRRFCSTTEDLSDYISSGILVMAGLVIFEAKD